jgi:signal transduction histidine kinase
MASRRLSSASAFGSSRREATRLRARLLDAEAQLRARQELLSIAAHELRTPMNALSLHLQTLERQARRQGHEAIVTELARANDLVQRYVRRANVLLEVSRLATGAFAIRRSICDLRELACDVSAAHAHEAAAHAVEVRCDVREDLVGQWDGQALEQVLSNLVSNGIRYGGGSAVVIRGWRDGDAAVLTVADKGPGIAEADRTRVFEKFERAMQHRRSRPGFGLGLWISRQLVEAHGGRIGIESPAGGGALFRVVLPFEPTTPPDA